MHTLDSLSLLAIAALPEPSSFQAQMMLLGGFAILAWVLMRRTIRTKKRRRVEEAEWRQQQRQADLRSDSAVPLADAPVEVLRWQAAMFDLQRELKAELETKICVLQAMLQLADQRIATLEGLAPSGTAAEGSVSVVSIQQLVAAGMLPEQIAASLGIELRDVERAAAAKSSQ